MKKNDLIVNWNLKSHIEKWMTIIDWINDKIIVWQMIIREWKSYENKNDKTKKIIAHCNHAIISTKIVYENEMIEICNCSRDKNIWYIEQFRFVILYDVYQLRIDSNNDVKSHIKHLSFETIKRIYKMLRRSIKTIKEFCMTNYSFQFRNEIHTSNIDIHVK